MYLRQKWIDVVKSKPKWSAAPFYTYRRIHVFSLAKMLRFLWYLSVITCNAGRKAACCNGHLVVHCSVTDLVISFDKLLW